MGNLHFYVIIVAGGSGKRMNTAVPKQFLEINGKPILMHTIEKFFRSEYQPEIILVLPESCLSLWQKLIEKYDFNIPHQIIQGGTERFHSVKNGLQKINNYNNSIIAIHDAVRPLVSVKTIDNCFKNAVNNGNAVAAVVTKDSIRIINSHSENSAVPRDSVFLVQTPQTFCGTQLEKAYLQEYNKNFTDDAVVVEHAGYPIFLEEGDHFNIKITYPEDISLAQALLKN